MKPKDYISKKAQEEALKAFGATQLNNNQETSAYFVGKISADRKKITDPEGRQYDLIFTGNPKQYELAQRLSNDTAVVNAQNNRTINIEGVLSRPVFVLRESNTSFAVYIPDNKVEDQLVLISSDAVSLDHGSPFNNPPEPSFVNSKGFIFTVKLSTNGKHLIIFKASAVQLNTVSTVTVPAIVPGVPGVIEPCGPIGLGCTVNSGTPPSQGSTQTEYVSAVEHSILCSYLIYPNFSIREGQLYSSSTINLENIEFITFQQFPPPTIVSVSPDPPNPFSPIEGMVSPGFDGLNSISFQTIYFNYHTAENYELLLPGHWFSLNSGSTGIQYQIFQFAVNTCSKAGNLCGTTDPVPTFPINEFTGFGRTSPALVSGGFFVLPVKSSNFLAPKFCQLNAVENESLGFSEQLSREGISPFVMTPFVNQHLPENIIDYFLTTGLYQYYQTFFDGNKFRLSFAWRKETTHFGDLFISYFNQDDSTIYGFPTPSYEAHVDLIFASNRPVGDFYIANMEDMWSVDRLASDTEFLTLSYAEFKSSNKIVAWGPLNVAGDQLFSEVRVIKPPTLETPMFRNKKIFTDIVIPSGYGIWDVAVT